MYCSMWVFLLTAQALAKGAATEQKYTYLSLMLPYGMFYFKG